MAERPNPDYTTPTADTQDDGDNTRRGNQGAVNNPPAGGGSHDADKFKAVPGVSGNTQAGPPNTAAPHAGGPPAAGGPQGSEANRAPDRPATQDGFSAPQRGLTDSEQLARDEKLEEQAEDVQDEA